MGEKAGKISRSSVWSRGEHGDVAEAMIDLYSLSGTHIERLVNGVESVCAIVAVGGPVGITSCRFGRLGAGIEPHLVPVFLKECASVVAPDLQCEA